MEINNVNGKTSGFSSFSVLLTFIALAIIGTALVPLLNIQLKPSRSLPTIGLDFSWPDASAKVIEQEVTSKLEGVLGGISGLEDISSISRKGSGEISLSLKKGTNLDLVRFEVSTLVRRLYPDFPEEVSYPVLSTGGNNSNQQTLLVYTLSASSSPYYIQKYAEDNFLTHLSAIESVNDVAVYGAIPFEWEIKINTDLLGQLNISSNDVSTAISNYFQQEVVGVANTGNGNNKKISVLLKNNLIDTLVWEIIPVTSVKSRVIYLKDIAKITYKEQEPESYYRINGLNTINMVVYATQGANVIKTANCVKKEIEVLKNNLPFGYNLILTYDASEFIRKDLIKIGIRSLFSIVILLVFIILITRQLRYVILIMLSLLINLIVAVIFYYFLKTEIHLYSLAGITVSFGIIIDNSIVMIDHYRYHGNKRVFLAILAATLTTIGALSVIFFLEESQRINLIDFVWVMLANLVVSLAVALFFIPSFMQKFPFRKKRGKIFLRRKRKIAWFNTFYQKEITFSKKFRWAFVIIFLFGFGLPVQWLPEKIEQENNFALAYNKTLGSDGFASIKSVLEKIMGGSLRLFSENVFESSFYSEPERTKLYIRGSMPEGCTVKQLNEAITRMENYISRFDEIDMFETSITSYRNSSIVIHFKPEYEFSSFPFSLKDMVTSKAISLGGLDWNVYGVGQGFSNALSSGYKSNQIILNGYNYDQLYDYAKILRDSLNRISRVRDVEIAGNISWGNENLQEYFIELNPEMFALDSLTLKQFYNLLNQRVYYTRLNDVSDGNELTPVRLISDKTEYFNSWWLNNEPFAYNNNIVKLPLLGEVSKRNTGNNIYKNNQQYRLIVAWDFIGPNKLAQKVIESGIESINKILPMGYKAHKRQYSYWNKKDKKQYFLIFLVIAIIYFLCSILLESFVQPLAIILMIPISFVGIFLTFFLFDFNFDQGGFASFILLSGLTVNAGLYIINDFNNIKKTKNLSSMKLYIKAFNFKIVPVFLTIISTLLGLVPFIWGGQKEVFWFSFAVGTIGGLIFSLIALFIYFPLFLKLKK